MPALKPEEFTALVNDVVSDRAARRFARVLPEAYTWLYRAAYDKSVTGEPTGKVTKERSDPTMDLAMSRSHARAKLKQAAALVKHAHDDLLEAGRICANALNAFDPPERPEPTRYPRSVRESELKLLREAGARRRSRGEDIA